MDQRNGTFRNALNGIFLFEDIIKREGDKVIVDLRAVSQKNFIDCPFCNFHTPDNVAKFVELLKKWFAVKRVVFVLFESGAYEVYKTERTSQWRDTMHSGACNWLPIINIGPEWDPEWDIVPYPKEAI